jgi:hypothetical protein
MATATLTAATVTTPRECRRLAEDLLAVAWQPGAAPPREIHVRPELLARLAPAVVDGLLGDPAGVPLSVDPQLPRSPGFEVHRVPPR